MNHPLNPSFSGNTFLATLLHIIGNPQQLSLYALVGGRVHYSIPERKKGYTSYQERRKIGVLFKVGREEGVD